MFGLCIFCPYVFKFVAAICLVTYVKADTLLDTLRREPKISMFYGMVAKAHRANITQLQEEAVTVFAPVDSAFQQAQNLIWDKYSEIVAYHVSFQKVSNHTFPSVVLTNLHSAAPIYLTYSNTGCYSEREYYANNANILKSLKCKSKEGTSQVIYVIDELIIPYVSRTSVPPDALELLNQPYASYYISQPFDMFSTCVRDKKQEPVLRREGNHTFFLPVGAKSDNPIQLNEEVIGGHVIPNHVLFMRVMGSENYATATYNSNIKVEISLVNETKDHDENGDGYTLKIKSRTLVGNTRHKTGVVLSRIVLANIPVKNGVVHIIDSPLMVFDSFMNILRKEGRLSKLRDLMYYPYDFKYALQETKNKTFFAPSNDAFELMGNEKFKLINFTSSNTLLEMHVVRGDVISSDDILTGRITEVQSMYRTNKLYFRALGDGTNQTFLVKGGGFNAVAVIADIVAKDGVIHIIDRVLGMPNFLTVFETLREVPREFSGIYRICQFWDECDRQLDDRTMKFTFFATSNEAWFKIEKQLKMNSFHYQWNRILNRHLVVGKEIDISMMDTMSSLQMVHENICIERKSNDIFLLWHGIRARIVRPDVEATNGIIHIIDRVLMDDDDLDSTVPVDRSACI